MLDLLAALTQQNIPNLAIKGLAGAYMLYPAPYLRLLPDADILVPKSKLGALTQLLRERDFVTRTDPASDRAWGALTKASFAPVTPRDGPEFFIDFHRLVVDFPACRAVPYRRRTSSPPRVWSKPNRIACAYRAKRTALSYWYSMPSAIFTSRVG